MRGNGLSEPLTLRFALARSIACLNLLVRAPDRRQQSGENLAFILGLLVLPLTSPPIGKAATNNAVH